MPQLTDLQKRTAQAIVNVFETGRVRGNYGRVTVARNDSGHLTYGRSQTTLASGNLSQLIRDYCSEQGAACAAQLEPYLDRLANADLTLDQEMTLRSALREAGNDPVMRVVQDRFFDRMYWEPACHRADRAGITTALGTTVVYDSLVHGSWGRIAERANAHGPLKSVGEKAWIATYIEERHKWLSSHSNPLLQRTTYRPTTFRRLIRENRWDLALPLDVHGVRIEEGMLSGFEPPNLNRGRNPLDKLSA